MLPKAWRLITSSVICLCQHVTQEFADQTDTSDTTVQAFWVENSAYIACFHSVCIGVLLQGILEVDVHFKALQRFQNRLKMKKGTWKTESCQSLCSCVSA